MLDTIKNQALTASMEADSIFARFNTITKRLPVLLNTVRNFVSDTVTLDSMFKSEVVYSGNTVKAINAINKATRYSELRNEPISVPSGFKGDLLKYAQTLENTVDLVSTIGKDRLDLMERWLAESLTDTKKLASLNARLSAKDLAPLPLEQHRVKLAAFFDFTVLSTDSTFGANYSRIDDLAKVDRLVDGFSKTLDAKNRTYIKEKLLKVVGLLDRFIEVIEKRADELNISSEVIKAVATKTFQLAEECDFYAVTCAQVIALNESVETTAVTLLAKYE